MPGTRGWSLMTRQVQGSLCREGGSPAACRLSQSAHHSPVLPERIPASQRFGLRAIPEEGGSPTPLANVRHEVAVQPS